MRINLNPKIWGSKGWFFLDSIALSYPTHPTDDDKNNFKNFFTLIGEMLPCEKCRINYGKHLRKMPLTKDVLKNKDTFFEWWVGIHNEARGYEVGVSDTVDYYRGEYIGTGMYKKILLAMIIMVVVICVIKKYYVG